MISILMRILLIVFSVGLLVHVLRSVRKAKVQIDDIIFWLLFCAALIFLAAFPQIAAWAARGLGIISPINLIYLIIIFLLLLKIFSLSVKFSQLETKVKSLTQELAVKECMEEGKLSPEKGNTEAKLD